MKADTYIVLKEKISELNKLNDEINLIEWNKDDEPKFTSVEEMKEFESKVISGKLDYIFDEEITNELKLRKNYNDDELIIIIENARNVLKVKYNVEVIKLNQICYKQGKKLKNENH